MTTADDAIAFVHDLLRPFNKHHRPCRNITPLGYKRTDPNAPKPATNG